MGINDKIAKSILNEYPEDVRKKLKAIAEMMGRTEVEVIKEIIETICDLKAEAELENLRQEDIYSC